MDTFRGSGHTVFIEPCDWTWRIGSTGYDYQAEPAIYTFIDYTNTYFAQTVVSPSLGTLTATSPNFVYPPNPNYHMTPNFIL